MSSMVDSGYQQPVAQPSNFSLPRRPLPARKAIPGQQQQTFQSPADAQYPSHPLHAHSRSASSGVLPNNVMGSQQQQPQPQQPNQTPKNSSTPPPPQVQASAQNAYYNRAQSSPPRRTYSNATSSSSSGGAVPQRRNSGTSSLNRSISSRSGGSSNSYVALMRKQKATVWSDRSQYEDPRIVAQQRAAKMRAAMEVSAAHLAPARASTSGSSSITGGVRAKIRHHGAQKAREYLPFTHPASGVPMRLSAREVEDEIDSEDEYLNARTHHTRSGSGRSSLGSGRLSQVPTAYGGSTALNMTPTNDSQQSSPGDADTPGSGRARAETQSTINSKSGPTPVPNHYRGDDYFSQTYVGAASEEAEKDFGGVGNLRSSKPPVIKQKDDSDLARRGSVDDRTSTMTGYKRLFIANPDVDSD